MKKIIIGNWKMNPATLDEAKRIFKKTRNTASKLSSIKVVACPPFVYIPNLLKISGDGEVAVGAQDVSFEGEGAHTGEVSVSMLKDMGVSYVIVGHSERRAQGESDETVARKVGSVLESDLHAVLCVGEKERKDDGSHLDGLKAQIRGSLNKVSKKYINKLILAYEPIWAIGASLPMEPATILEMSIFVKKVLSDIYGHDPAVSTPVLYGGSVNFRNAGDIVVKGGVDGLLVGRESVNALGFSELLKAIDIL